MPDNVKPFRGYPMFNGPGQLLRLFSSRTDRLSPCIIDRLSRRLRSAQVDLHAQTSMQHALPPEDFRASQVVSQFRLVRNMAADADLPGITNIHISRIREYSESDQRLEPFLQISTEGA